jgi:hypothetical protein
MDACMGARLGPDRIGAARVVWLSNERIVASFAIRLGIGWIGVK